MPSPSKGRYSLRLRVALTNAVTAVIVGLGAAAAATWLVEELTTTAQDERLHDIATVLEADLQQPRPIEQSVDDEAEEVASVGVRIALFTGGVRRAGSVDVAAAAAPGCSSTTDASGSAWRTCAFDTKAGRIVATAPRRGTAGTHTILLVSIAAATLLAALFGIGVSGALARWALSPLTSLNGRLRRVTTSAPGKADLGDASGAMEVEALRETLRALLARLGVALDQSRDFAASAAHELRTPLALMTAELDLAAERSPRTAQDIARVRQTLSRLTRLVQSLLTLAGDSSSLSDFREAVALEDVVREVVVDYPPEERSRIATTFEDTGMVRGDETLLRVVVENLTDNALKFDPKGLVLVTVSEDAGRSAVLVSDEGPGVDPAQWERLLRPFERGGLSAAGHGLGLTIAAHVVRLHGGELALVPRDRGTQIRVSFPAWTSGVAADEERTETSVTHG